MSITVNIAINNTTKFLSFVCMQCNKILPLFTLSYLMKLLWYDCKTKCELAKCSRIDMILRYLDLCWLQKCDNSEIVEEDTDEGLLTRRSPPEVFYRKGVLRNFAKFTGKHLCQTIFFLINFQAQFY